MSHSGAEKSVHNAKIAVATCTKGYFSAARTLLGRQQVAGGLEYTAAINLVDQEIGKLKQVGDLLASDRRVAVAQQATINNPRLMSSSKRQLVDVETSTWRQEVAAYKKSLLEVVSV